MKYKLEPDNRNCPDNELLADLCAVAKKLAKQSITKDDYDKHGRFCAATMRKRFGSWNKALAQSGLAVQKRQNIPQEELIEDLRRVAAKTGMQTVTREGYRLNGSFSEASLVRQFGNWAGALSAANLQSTGWKPQASEEDLFDNMATVWEHIGRQPKQKDFVSPISRYSAATYVKYYGSWRAALEAFVASANSENATPAINIEPISQPSVALPTNEPLHRAGRNPSWRLRFLVMRRDNFKCCFCGRSPATHSGLVLHVDHRKAWSKGGPTELGNLQTLCEQCNIGKSDLPVNHDAEEK